MRTVKSYPEAWPLHSPFVISRGSRTEAHVVVVEIEQDGLKGIGEATPYARYGESEASVLQQIASQLGALQNGMTRAALQQTLPAGAARNAIDCALWDLERQQQRTSLAALCEAVPAQEIVTAHTVSIDTPEAMASSALALWQHGARLLKIKLDNHLISERLVAIRSAVPEATLIVDANESWQAEGLAARCQLLADLGRWRCWSSRCRPRRMRRWPILSIRYRSVRMRAATRATVWQPCTGATRWSISSSIKPAG